MLIAIDHGNHACKTIHFNFVSGLAQHSVRPPMAEEVLEYNGEFWTLSGQRLPYRRDKTRDESFFILTLFAIAKELAYAGPLPSAEKIDLAVGLPPEHYGLLKDKFRDYFKRNQSVQFLYNDKPDMFCFDLKGKGYQASRAILDELAPVVPGESDGIKSAEFYEIVHSKAPCAYVEAAFHDNVEQASWIISHIDAIAEAICKGICKYFAVDYIEPESHKVNIYRVQVGAFVNYEYAEAMMEKLREAGFDGFIAKE